MLDRVKAAVFDMLGSYFGTPGRLPSLVVADVFAGGGTLGLEALSRGARVCVFVERDKAALAVLRRNLHDLQVGPEGIIEPIDGWGCDLPAVLSEHGCSLVLLDPPYQDLRDAQRRSKLAALLGALSRPDRWADPPVILLHYPAETKLDFETLGTWQVQLTRHYGTSGIALLKQSRSDTASTPLVGAVSDRDPEEKLE
jgi:16S rRNA (guanine(966)-N(2))-methyltransferase RsmD